MTSTPRAAGQRDDVPGKTGPEVLPAEPGRARSATPPTREELVPTRSPRSSASIAFRALLLRDLVVLRKNIKEFLPRTLLQPLLLVFVFAYVFPKIGQSVGGSGAGATEFSTQLVAGVVGLAVIFQGIQSVALPMVQEFGYTREIEDRVLAPMPVGLVAFEKVTAGALYGAVSALLVFPIAAVVPATPVHLHVNWVLLLTLTPLACFMCGALGLAFGTRFDPRTVPMLFGLIVLPLTMLGCIYYPWKALAGVPWLQKLVLVNPLVYMCEGFRAALTNGPHMSLWAIYPAMIGFLVLFLWTGLSGFRKRVLT
jgi:ABC-2 type transport system permease protein